MSPLSAAIATCPLNVGEWFRRMDEEQGFFGHFFSPCMEFCETGEFPVQPIHLAEYLRQHPPATEVELAPEMQAAALVASLGAEVQAAQKRLFAVVARYWSVARAASTESGPSRATLLEVRELTLRAEASDFLLGDASRRDEMLNMLERADRLLASKPVQSRKAAQPEPLHRHGKSAAPETEKLLIQPLAIRPGEPLANSLVIVETSHARSHDVTNSHATKAKLPEAAAKSLIMPKAGNPLPSKQGVELTLDETTSHSTDELTSHSTRLSKDASQVAGYKLPETAAKSLVIPTVGNPLSSKLDKASLRDVNVNEAQVTPPAPTELAPIRKRATAKVERTVQSRTTKKTTAKNKKKTHKK